MGRIQLQFQEVKDIKVRVFKWRESIIHEDFSDCVLLHGCVINETMHLKKKNQDFLAASRYCNIVNLEPRMDYLPSSQHYSSQTWYRLCFLLFSNNNGEGLIDRDFATHLSKIISEFLVTNYHAVRGKRDFKIVVAINVYMKSFIDESPGIGPPFLYSGDGLSIRGILLFNTHNYDLEQRERICHVHDFLLETEEKAGIVEEFLKSNRNSLLNLYPSSGDEGMIGGCILEWLKKKELVCLYQTLDHSLEEVKPALKIKKYDAGCSKNSEQSCSICLEDLCEGDEVAIMPCSHVFHCNAIIYWLTCNITCPMCRGICQISL